MSLHLLHALLWMMALAALAASSWNDLKYRIIPNELVGVIAAIGIGLSLALRPGQTGISLVAAAVVLLALGVFSHFNMMGGGDVKLISATTLLVPPDRIGQLLVAIALAGGVLACIYLMARHALRRNPPGAALIADEAGARGRSRVGWLSNECTRIASGGPMPYALAILGGVAVHIATELPKCLSASFCSL